MASGSKSKASVFDLIAPVYGLFFHYQKRKYRDILKRMSGDAFPSTNLKVLDIGCGTGALCAVFQEMGFMVTGVDPSRNMLDIASGKEENKAVTFLQASALEPLPFPDKSFDISISSFVAHGLQPADREVMYAEMRRVTRDLVIFHDYNDARSMAVNFIEWLEGGDYFNFIVVVRDELRKAFGHLRIVNVDNRVAWYMCTPE